MLACDRSKSYRKIAHSNKYLFCLERGSLFYAKIIVEHNQRAAIT